MPFVYSTSTPGTSAGQDSSAAIPLAPVGRWMRPFGSDLGASVNGQNLAIHVLPRHLQFLPFRPQYNMSFDRIGMQFYNMNSCTDTWYYKFGLYSSADNYPKDLIADYGTFEIDPNVPTLPGPLEKIVDQPLTGGLLYWFAIGVNQSGGDDQANFRTPLLGMLNGDYVNMKRRGQAQTGMDGMSWLEQFNSFGGTFPASTTFANNSGGGSWAIRPVIRRSA